MADAVADFECAFARWLGVPWALAAGFGRSALKLALAACGARGRDVLVPQFICAQVPEAVRRAGGRAVFYPVERDLSILPDGLRAALTPHTCAAIVPHYFGRVLPQIEALAETCRERSVLLIEDCALAMGASQNDRRAGSFGDVAIFSLTKSDWCYGGGVAATRWPQLAEGLLQIRDPFSANAPLARRYGRLRRVDFLSNCPRWSRAAESVGRRLERAAGFETGNFYDAGGYEEKLQPFAAQRAMKILRGLSADVAARRRGLEQLCDALQSVRHILFHADTEAGDAASFLLLRSPAGRAAEWQAEAARSGVTLRLTWPAYQSGEAHALGANAPWFADHLLFLEIHQRLCAEEIEQIASCLRTLGGRE
jgi:dTDP-4-amino-4,6-dideoxygalactose transaminase